MRQISLPKILYIFQRHKDIVYKDKDELLKTKMNYQRQRCPKDVPKTKALREDVKDGDSKDKDAKDKLDVFLMLKCSQVMEREVLMLRQMSQERSWRRKTLVQRVMVGELMKMW